MHTDVQRILIVDDDFDQQLLTKRALQKVVRANSTLHIVPGGYEAIAYLKGEGKFADRERYPFPSLVITDLNMAEGDGFEVLDFMRANPGWNVIPRVVFSSSDDDYDVRTTYFLGASVYHLKPMTSTALEKMMRDLVAYWSSAEVPPVDDTGRILAINGNGRLSARFAQPQAGLQRQRPNSRDS